MGELYRCFSDAPRCTGGKGASIASLSKFFSLVACGRWGCLRPPSAPCRLIDSVPTYLFSTFLLLIFLLLVLVLLVLYIVLALLPLCFVSLSTIPCSLYLCHVRRVGSTCTPATMILATPANSCRTLPFRHLTSRPVRHGTVWHGGWPGLLTSMYIVLTCVREVSGWARRGEARYFFFRVYQ